MQSNSAFGSNRNSGRKFSDFIAGPNLEWFPFLLLHYDAKLQIYFYLADINYFNYYFIAIQQKTGNTQQCKDAH